MVKNIIATLILFLAASCADNPLGLIEGMWVKNKLDGQKYYITYLSIDRNGEHGGFVKVKNEFGVEVDKDFAIHDFELWIERKEIPDGAVDSLESQLSQLKKDLEDISRRTQAVEDRLNKPATERKWNPETQRYE